MEYNENATAVAAQGLTLDLTVANSGGKITNHEETKSAEFILLLLLLIIVI